jgi:hypothetical protein
MSRGEIAIRSRAERKRPGRRKLAPRPQFTAADDRVKAIGADDLALKLLLPTLLSRIGRLDPILGSAIHEGFQDATDQIEYMIASCRRAETRDRCSSALASILKIRAAVHTGLSSSAPSPARP